MRDPIFVLAALCLFTAVSEWLVRRTWLRHFGTALMVILVTAAAANLGIVPAGSTAKAPVAVYDAIFAHLAPLGIFWLLLRVNLRDILRAGIPIVALFLIGSAGIMLGAFVGASVVPLDSLGRLHAALGGMFVGTYTGGSINFNAIALEYGVMREGGLYTGAVAVDNVVTTAWMAATIALPRLLAPLWRRAAPRNAGTLDMDRDIAEDTETLHPFDLFVLALLGFATLYVSGLAAAATGIPAILILTAIALALAQIPWFGRLRGARLLGMVAVLLFLAVIGAFCDLRQLGELGRLGLILLGFATAMVLVHGFVVFGAARLLRMDVDIAAIASQANVGGSTSALALARSLGRADLVLPAVLIGALGNAIGTFLGFWVAGMLA
jgi:uncharacterized membrane protein